jgi:hypothetical protein
MLLSNSVSTRPAMEALTRRNDMRDEGGMPGLLLEAGVRVTCRPASTSTQEAGGISQGRPQDHSVQQAPIWKVRIGQAQASCERRAVNQPHKECGHRWHALQGGGNNTQNHCPCTVQDMTWPMLGCSGACQTVECVHLLIW